MAAIKSILLAVDMVTGVRDQAAKELAQAELAAALGSPLGEGLRCGPTARGQAGQELALRNQRFGLESGAFPGARITVQGWDLTAESAAGRRNRIGTVLAEPVTAPADDAEANAEEAAQAAWHAAEDLAHHLLRHGEVFNPDGILYGRLPGYHLSELGRQMAAAAAIAA